MLKVKRLTKKNNTGLSIVILWLFAITFMFSMDGKGDHINIGFCIGPVEFSTGFSIWRKLLP